MIQDASKGVKEIPIPGIVHVRTYGTDYLPVRRERNTYIRPKGGGLQVDGCSALSRSVGGSETRTSGPKVGP